VPGVVGGPGPVGAGHGADFPLSPAGAGAGVAGAAEHHPAGVLGVSQDAGDGLRAPPVPVRGRRADLPAHRIHLATLAGGVKWVADLQDEEPHLFIAAGTGGGKTATASVPAAHVRAHGWLVDIIDPKRHSYIDRKTGKDVLTNVPGIRVHTDIESMMWALEEFFLSMLGVNIAVGQRAAWPGVPAAAAGH